jgi:hypothetical protein
MAASSERAQTAGSLYRRAAVRYFEDYYPAQKSYYEY